jgi:hypothetical protein
MLIAAVSGERRREEKRREEKGVCVLDNAAWLLKARMFFI